MGTIKELDENHQQDMVSTIEEIKLLKNEIQTWKNESENISTKFLDEKNRKG